MTVLHISGAQVWGGNEQQLIYLISELDVLGVQQKIFCFKDSPLFRAVSNLPIEIIATAPLSPYSSKYRNFLSDIVEDKQIDVIHLHTSDSVTGYVVTDLIKRLRTPTLFARKGIRNKTSFLSKQKYNYKNIHGILCISEYVKEHFGAILSEKNRKKLVVVYNGVKIEDMPANPEFQIKEKLKLSSETFIIGNIANHTNAKDLPTLVKVLEHIVCTLKVKDIHLVQLGDHSKNTEVLREMVKEKKLESYITFMGFVKNASSYLSQFDVFLMTSEREGGPSSVVEALYKKTPVISTRVGVVDEIIEDGVNGFSSEVRDVEGLAIKVVKFKDSPKLSDQFSKLSYDIFLKKFTADQLGKKTFAVYENLINDHKKTKKLN